jgi:fibronectin type 3 domain-containing protein
VKKVVLVLFLALCSFASAQVRVGKNITGKQLNFGPMNPTQHQVNLSWTQSTTPGITSNCVYRSVTSGGPYTQLACSTGASTQYTDSTVVGGNTYYYVVTALVNTQESNYSNQVQAIIPNVLPPTGLQAVSQ